MSAIQKAITTGKIPARAVGPTRLRRLDEVALLAFALSEALPSPLRLSPGDAYRLLRGTPTDRSPDQLAIDDVVLIDAGKALAAVRGRLQLYDRARRLIVSDPAIMGGMPVIQGTRITAQSILGRLQDGDSVDTVLGDYPLSRP